LSSLKVLSGFSLYHGVIETKKESTMAAIIILSIIVLVIGARFWIEVRQFDRMSTEAAATRSREQGLTAVPLRADYYF
jgi:hypothetical protein